MRKGAASLGMVAMLCAAPSAPLPAAVAAAETRAADERELRRLKEELWPRAYREGDVALLDSLLADEFQMVDPEGGWSTKAQELERAAGRRWRNRSFRFEVRRLDVFDNGTAVVAGRGVVIGPESDPGGGYQYQSSNVLIRRDGRWQAIASHVSGVRELAPAELAADGSFGGPEGCANSAEDRAALRAWAAAGFPVTAADERRRRALELAGCLGDPDPALRDGVAFAALSAWLRGGAIDEPTRLELAERLLPQVAAEEDAAGFRRPFAALALAEVARADRLAPALPAAIRARIVEAAAGFLTTTRDYRAFEDGAGWRHAVAHGADLVLQTGLHPQTTAAEARRLLAAVATQVAPPGVAYVAGEPERLARAVFFLHGRNVLDDAWWDGWFAALGDPAPLTSWSQAFETEAGLARRHDVVAFLQALAFAQRANPGPASDRLGELAHRELVKVHGG
jgi:hypothetical protein